MAINNLKNSTASCNAGLTAKRYKQILTHCDLTLEQEPIPRINYLKLFKNTFQITSYNQPWLASCQFSSKMVNGSFGNIILDLGCGCQIKSASFLIRTSKQSCERIDIKIYRLKNAFKRLLTLKTKNSPDHSFKNNNNLFTFENLPSSISIAIAACSIIFCIIVAIKLAIISNRLNLIKGLTVAYVLNDQLKLTSSSPLLSTGLDSCSVLKDNILNLNSQEIAIVSSVVMSLIAFIKFSIFLKKYLNINFDLAPTRIKHSEDCKIYLKISDSHFSHFIKIQYL